MTAILVVEDDSEHRFLLETHLVRAGCTVTTVVNAEDAMERFLLKTPDIVIVDLQLPGMTGWEFVRWLRIPGRPRCTVVSMSVLEFSDHPVVDGFLLKPFTRLQVLELLNI